MEVKVIVEGTPEDFEREVGKYLKDGWYISSTSSGINELGDIYNAILIYDTLAAIV